MPLRTQTSVWLSMWRKKILAFPGERAIRMGTDRSQGRERNAYAREPERHRGSALGGRRGQSSIGRRRPHAEMPGVEAEGSGQGSIERAQLRLEGEGQVAADRPELHREGPEQAQLGRREGGQRLRGRL